ncbi:MAG TPA: ATP-binding protein [Chryseolinea sp.]|nr:ATP-binding protein [Chryseolinea sp.]
MKDYPDIISNAGQLAMMLNDASINRVMAVNKELNIIAWNTTAEIITGLPRNGLIGTPLFQAFPLLKEDPEVMDAIRQALAGNKSFLPARKDLFNREHYENHFIPLREEGGPVIGVMNVMHEVSHRIKAEQQLHKLNLSLEKNYHQLEMAGHEMSKLTFITSNNIKEPVRFVYTGLELLMKSEVKHLSQGSVANLRRMQGALNRTNLLLDDILAISKINSFMDPPQPVDLNVVYEHAANALKRKISESQATISTAVLPTITGHQELLEMLFFHLIDNGLKFQPNDRLPTLTITSSPVILEDREDEIGPDMQFDRISFSDNGIGFAATDADRIFNMFEKLHPPTVYKGSGIGLTICKKVIAVHEGSIEAESKEGIGTSFHCYFPIVPAL